MVDRQTIMATLDEVREGLDKLVQRGDVVALLRDDGEIGYWPAERITPEQWPQRLSIQQIRNLRRAQTKLTKPQ